MSPRLMRLRAPAAVSRGPRSGSVFLHIFLLLCVLAPVRGEESKDKKDAKKPEPPRAILALPLAIPAGRTNKVQIRGQFLTNVAEAHWTVGAAGGPLKILAQSTVEVPKDADVKRVGDTLLELEMQPPSEAADTTNRLVLTNPIGLSEPISIVILAPGSLLDEQEPNGGFRNAQRVLPGQTVRGMIKESGDVDVFQFEGQRGERLRIEVVAAALGSSLDSVVSVLDANGHLLSTVDDVAGRADSVLMITLPQDGTYFVSVTDAHDRGGTAHAYLFRMARLAP